MLKKRHLLWLLPLIAFMYIIGVVWQAIRPVPAEFGTAAGSVIDYSPIACIEAALSPDKGLVIFAVVVVGLITLFRGRGRFSTAPNDERNFRFSEKGTYGTARWLDAKRLPDYFDQFRNPKDAREMILGRHPETGKIITFRKDWAIVNRNGRGQRIEMPSFQSMCVVGAPGTGKSFCLSINYIICAAARGESVIVVDTKGALFADTAEYMKAQGYEVRLFNLIDPNHSDGWDMLAEVGKDQKRAGEYASIFADIVLENTSPGASGDDFFVRGEKNLLRALVLLLQTHKDIYGEGRDTIGALYSMLTTKGFDDVAAEFEAIKVKDQFDPALQAFNIFNGDEKTTDTIRSSVFQGLATRIQLFQTKSIARLMGSSDIDLQLPAQKKCAYYVNVSDMNRSFDYLSSMFFSFIFLRLMEFADAQPDRKCPVPVNFLLDEFTNIGKLPDFPGKMATIRSRALRVVIIFQSLDILENRYPGKEAGAILGCFSAFACLGVAPDDLRTAKLVSEIFGTGTVSVASENVSKNTYAVAQLYPDYRQSIGVGKRSLLNPDEVLSMKSIELLIRFKEDAVLKLEKFGYPEHPESRKFKILHPNDYIPVSAEREKLAAAERDRIDPRFTEPPEEPEEPEDTQDPEEPEEPEMWEEPEPTGSHANVNGLAGDAANYGTGCEAEAQLTMPPTEKKKRRVIRRGDIR